MKDYKRLKLSIICFIIFYFFVGLSTEILLPNRQKDFIPFFSWFLFTNVPSEHTQKYALRILAVGDEKLEKPLLFEYSGDLVHEARSPKARELIAKIGRAETNGSHEESKLLRKMFESIYLPSPTQYELVIISYNPITRFKNGTYEIFKHLGEYNTYKL